MTHPLPSKKGGDCWNLFSDLELCNIYIIIDFKQHHRKIILTVQKSFNTLFRCFFERFLMNFKT